MSNNGSKIWCVAHDLHYPLTNWPAFKALCDFLSQNKVDGFTFGGDQLDLNCISHHTEGKGLYRLPGSYLKDVKGFDIKILRPIEKLIGKCERIYHIGNHERFEADLIERRPELQDAIDHVKILDLESRGWTVVPLGHNSKIGKLNVCHGEILTGIGNQAGMYPSRKAVDLYGGSVLAGHTHSPQSFAKISPVENVQKHMGWIAPCLCDVNPSYLRNRPTAWVNGFTIVEVQDNGAFNVYPVIITKGTFSFGGKVYGGK